MCGEFKFKGLLSLQMESFECTFKSRVPPERKGQLSSAHELNKCQKNPRTNSLFYRQESFAFSTVNWCHLKLILKYNVNASFPFQFLIMFSIDWILTVCVCVCACSVTQSCLTLRPHGLYPASLLCPWNSPGKNAFPTPGDFPDPGIELKSLVSCLVRQILYHGTP